MADREGAADPTARNVDVDPAVAPTNPAPVPRQAVAASVGVNLGRCGVGYRLGARACRSHSSPGERGPSEEQGRRYGSACQGASQSDTHESLLFFWPFPDQKASYGACSLEIDTASQIAQIRHCAERRLPYGISRGPQARMRKPLPAVTFRIRKTTFGARLAIKAPSVLVVRSDLDSPMPACPWAVAGGRCARRPQLRSDHG